MNILVGIPCLYGPEHCREAINSVIGKPNVTVLVIDNGADASVKTMINSFIGRPDFMVISNPVNVYVNPAWNQIMHTFININKWDLCIIMNSDIIMQENWADVLRMFIKPESNISCIPHLSDDKYMRKLPDNCSAHQVVREGTPGIFITLTRKQIDMVYPIPENCRVWFGDNWIYDILRSTGHDTIIPQCLMAHHYWSQTVQRLPGISEIIEEDKVQWATIVGPKAQEKILEIKKLA